MSEENGAKISSATQNGDLDKEIITRPSNERLLVRPAVLNMFESVNFDLTFCTFNSALPLSHSWDLPSPKPLPPLWLDQKL
jgi:hypothetical protein